MAVGIRLGDGEKSLEVWVRKDGGPKTEVGIQRSEGRGQRLDLHSVS